MAPNPRPADRPKHTGWAKGCGIIAGIMGLGTIALVALLLAGYTLDDLRAGPPDRDTTAAEMQELVEVVDEAYEDGASASAPKATATFTPTPTATPTPTPAAPEPQADPEPSDAVVPFEDLILGILLKAPAAYATGATAVMGGSNSYTFAETDACAMKVVVHAMPTTQIPGATPLEALAAFYQDLVDSSISSAVFEVVAEPFELEVNGQPAARMVANREASDKLVQYQLTAIRGDSRSGLVEARIGGGSGCLKTPAALVELTTIADSVELTDPAPLCYVGRQPDTDPVAYGVGCDFPERGYDGRARLADRDFTEIELGPVTWDEAAAFMRDHGQPRW